MSAATCPAASRRSGEAVATTSDLVFIPPGLLLRSFTEVPLASESAPAWGLQRACGKIPPTLRWPGTQGSGPHAFNEREAFCAEGFDVADDLVPQKREDFFVSGCRFFHDGSVLSRQQRGQM
jgi:hypothetical protein